MSKESEHTGASSNDQPPSSPDELPLATDAEELDKISLLGGQATLLMYEYLFLKETPLGRVSGVVMDTISQMGIDVEKIVARESSGSAADWDDSDETDGTFLVVHQHNNGGMLFLVEEDPDENSVTLLEPQTGEVFFTLYIASPGKDSITNKVFYISNRALSSLEKLTKRILSIVVTVMKRMTKELKKQSRQKSLADLEDAMYKKNEQNRADYTSDYIPDSLGEKERNKDSGRHSQGNVQNDLDLDVWGSVLE